MCVPLYFVSKLARDSGTIVVQVGEGSDEIFHGYKGTSHARVRFARYESLLRAPAAPCARAPAARPSRVTNRVGRATATRDALDERRRAAAAVLGRGDRLRGRPQGARARATARRPTRTRYDLVDELLAGGRAPGPDADLLQRMTYVELKQRLSELLLMRVDKMTMATSVEARVPFLDHELVEFAMALPAAG